MSEELENKTENQTKKPVKLSEHTKKINTAIFSIITGLLNVVLMLAFMALLLFISVQICNIFKLSPNIIHQISIPIILILGFVLDFKYSPKIFKFFIIKLNLEHKLTKKVADHYLYDDDDTKD